MGYETDSKRGVYNQYGPRPTLEKFGGRIDDDVVKYAVWAFSYDDLPAAGTDKLILSIPQGSVPLEAYFQTITAFAGGTSYDIDLVDNTGAAIGSGEDKLWDALVTADINAEDEVGLSSTHGGTNSGNALNVALASAGQLQVVATGTFTAGKGRIIVKYLTVSPEVA